MAKNLDIENRLFNSAFSKTNEKDFYIAFIDYFEFIQKSDDITICFGEEIMKRKQDEEELNFLYKEARNDFITLYESIKKDIASLEIYKSDYIQQQIKDINSLMDGSTATTGSAVGSSILDLIDIMSSVLKDGNEELVKKYCTLSNGNPLYIKKLKGLDKINAWEKAKKTFDENDELRIRGVVTRLASTYGNIIHSKKHFEEIAGKKDASPQERLQWLFLSMPASEWTSIINNEINHSRAYFVMSKTKADLERFHNHILHNYTEDELTQITEKTLDEVSFDTQSSKIILNRKGIKITKGKDIYYIIKYIFERENIYEECFYDEIRESSELDSVKDKTDKNIYDALLQFNKRLINAGINDLFIIDFHSIKVNTKYNTTTL